MESADKDFKTPVINIFQDLKETKNMMREQIGNLDTEMKILQIINAGEGVEKKEPSYTVGVNENWCSPYGKQHGGSLTN